MQVNSSLRNVLLAEFGIKFFDYLDEQPEGYYYYTDDSEFANLLVKSLHARGLTDVYADDTIPGILIPNSTYVLQQESETLISFLESCGFQGVQLCRDNGLRATYTVPGDFTALSAMHRTTFTRVDNNTLIIS